MNGIHEVAGSIPASSTKIIRVNPRPGVPKGVSPLRGERARGLAPSAGATANAARKGDRAPFEAYLERYVTGPASHVDYLEEIGVRRLIELEEWA